LCRAAPSTTCASSPSSREAKSQKTSKTRLKTVKVLLKTH
jgi:hypothetical protein